MSTKAGEDQDLLGHKSGGITTHYSAAELHNLLEAANKVCDMSSQKSFTLLRTNKTNSATVVRKNPHKTPTETISNQDVQAL